jgi:hypothetical protein
MFNDVQLLQQYHWDVNLKVFSLNEKLDFFDQRPKTCHSNTKVKFWIFYWQVIKWVLLELWKRMVIPIFLSINSPNKFSNRWMTILGKKMLDPKKRVLAFKTRASCLRYVILPICFFFKWKSMMQWYK